MQTSSDLKELMLLVMNVDALLHINWNKTLPASLHPYFMSSVNQAVTILKMLLLILLIYGTKFFSPLGACCCAYWDLRPSQLAQLGSPLIAFACLAIHEPCL